MTDLDWTGYLDTFHGERPGITETILARASDPQGITPYDWMVEPLAELTEPGTSGTAPPRSEGPRTTQGLTGTGPVLDLGCGSGPLASAIGGRWVGLDRSPAELALAAKTAPGRVVLGDAHAVPLPSGAAEALICSMGLMLFSEPDRVATEMARLLRPGGSLVALLPATGPLTIRDWIRYVRLLAALRLPRMPFRHNEVLIDPSPVLERAGLRLVDNQRRRFDYAFTDPDAAMLWIRSLYLGAVKPGRAAAAERLARRWTRASIGIPLRRVVATKPESRTPGSPGPG